MTPKLDRSNTLRAGILWVAAMFAGVVPAAGILVVPSSAHAVIGRPFTPVSYAGVARRTSRRVARRTVARTAAVTSLPAGCAAGGAYYTCGAVRYQQVYDAGTVTYVVVH